MHIPGRLEGPAQGIHTWSRPAGVRRPRVAPSSLVSRAGASARSIPVRWPVSPCSFAHAHVQLGAAGRHPDDPGPDLARHVHHMRRLQPHVKGGAQLEGATVLGIMLGG